MVGAITFNLPFRLSVCPHFVCEGRGRNRGDAKIFQRMVGWLIGFIISDQGFERTRQQSQNVYKNRDSCLVVLVDLFAQTERASNVFKNYPGLEARGRFLV